MKVYVICRIGCEEHSIYAVCGTEARAREMYDKLRIELIDDIKEILEYHKKEGRGGSLYDQWKEDVECLGKFCFPDVRPDHSCTLTHPWVEIYAVLE